ncbi:alpha/beta fold hydrolase [Gordonia rhizosphera]|uniref:Putative hydrolase n=1 Tax=Gordonia rhizosphera NBRC 16068 TaxID=1108045 RepID=K6W8T2_9ACTN|nr:alpha/beta hydrolase [Gordonia rhizosphera]GAB90156.1 putative hydrolase [Gordonia rhizosphera NBRC 16068]
MTTQTHDVATLSVMSADGTPIGAHVSGSGRPLVLLHGASSDSSTWRMAAEWLEPHVRVIRVDRRGRGLSGDRSEYTIEAEYDDAVAVVDAAAEAYGAPVDLLGHSYGGNVAFGAGLRTKNIRRLMLYEGWPPPNPEHRRFPAEMYTTLEELATTRPEDMLRVFLRDCAGLTADELAQLEAAPSWPARVAAAPTVPREVRAFGHCAFDPRTAAGISVPTMLLVGSESTDEVKADPEIVAAAIPDARIRVLDGQTHMAHLAAPEDFASAVLEFLRD